MATKKTTRPPAALGARSEPVVVDVQKLPPAQQERIDKLLPEAAAVIERIENRMVALATAAIKRWQPDATLHETDEDGPPVLDLDDFLETVDEVGECAMLREIAIFFGLPSTLVDLVLTEKLRSAYVTVPPPRKNDKGFTVKRARRPT